jgi:putative transposase
VDFNRRHGRTDPFWEGRYKSCLVDSDTYAFTRYRHIELNPVRSRIIVHPVELGWPGYATNALGKPEALISLRASYIALARDDTTRSTAYAALFQSALSATEIAKIRLYLQQQRAFGSDAAQRMVPQKTFRFSGVRSACRPKKHSSHKEK